MAPHGYRARVQAIEFCANGLVKFGAERGGESLACSRAVVGDHGPNGVQVAEQPARTPVSRLGGWQVITHLTSPCGFDPYVSARSLLERIQFPRSRDTDREGGAAPLPMSVVPAPGGVRDCEDVIHVATRANSSDDQPAGLSLRLAARPAQASLLRAHLRLWLTEQQVGDDAVLDILVAATEAFNNAVAHARQPRSIAVHVEARISHAVVELVVRDHGGWQGDQSGADVGLGLSLMHTLMDTVDTQTTREGTTFRLRRALGRHRIGGAAIAPALDRLDLLWRDPIFAPLPSAMRERLAAQLVPVSASVDETIIREGDRADRFFLIAQGHLDVSAARRHIATLGPGDHAGEIALLRNVPRTATVVAKEPVELYALTAEEFLSAITRHQASRQAALNTAATRLAELQDVLAHTA